MFTLYLFLALFLGLGLGWLFQHLRFQKVILNYELLKEKYQLQEKFHQDSNEKLELRLKDLSQKIFDDKTRRFKEESLQGMEMILNPFREKMTDFQQRVEQMHMTDTKDRIKLFSEIERIVLTGQKIGQDAENLARALKGDVKLQGNWGEMILERVLEASGLRPEEEFTLQGKDLGLKDEDGRHQMPDVIIHLPEGKHLIIDAKVSLVSYERYINDGSEEDLSSFLDSLYEHIKGLSKKNYHLLEKLIAPDYVMLFVPIEGAFTLSIQKDQELFNYAWQRNIVIVSPSTLLAALRTVSSLWRQEKQNKNALEIARQAGALYDKFVGVANDLDLMQSQIRKVGDAFDGLKNKMLIGKGSLASRMENLKALGAKSTKNIQGQVD